MKVIKIGATWCGSCLVMKKIFSELEIMYPDIEFESLDLDFDKEKVSTYNIGNTIPLVIIIKDGGEKERLIGDYTKEQISECINKYK